MSKVPHCVKEILESNHPNVDVSQFWNWCQKHQHGTAKKSTKVKDTAKNERTILKCVQQFRSAKPKGAGKHNNSNFRPASAGSVPNGAGKGKGTPSFASVHLPQMDAFQLANGDKVPRKPLDVLYEGETGLYVDKGL